MLTASNEHEGHQWRHPLGAIRRIPERCIWSITNQCNLECIHCETHAKFPHANELSLQQMTQVADELCDLGCRRVNLTGGEPLLSPHWEGLCKYLKQLGLCVQLITNGTWLDDAMIGRLLRAGVNGLSVSVDGLRDTHNRTRIAPTGHPTSAFDSTLDGIRRALPHLPVGIITQINQDNWLELESLGELLGSLGVEHWQLQLAIPNAHVQALGRPYVLAPEQLPALADLIVQGRAHTRFPPIEVTDTIGYCSRQELEIRNRTVPMMWFGCNAGVRLLSISCAGKVRGCSGLPAEFDAGSLHHESLADIWNDEKRFSYVTQFDPTRLTGGCARCLLGTLCRAGCPIMSYYTTGTIYENRHCLRLLEGAAHEGSDSP